MWPWNQIPKDKATWVMCVDLYNKAVQERDDVRMKYSDLVQKYNLAADEILQLKDAMRSKGNTK